MSNSQQFEECLICSKTNKTMFSLQEVLIEFDGFSVAEILEYLHLLKFSDSNHLARSLCFMCVAKIQTCFEFKTQCTQIEESLGTQAENIVVEPSISATFFMDNTLDGTENAVDLTADENMSEHSNDHKTQVYETTPSRNYYHSESTENQESDEEKFTPTIENSIDPLNNGSEANKHDKNHWIDFSNCHTKFKSKSLIESRTFGTSSTATDDANILCPICQKSFKSAWLMREHMRVHTGEKPYHCTVCDKSFANSSNFSKHKKVHTGNKPYQCEICYKSFGRSSHLKRHKMTHPIFQG